MSSELKSPADFDSLLELVLYFREEKTCLDYLLKWIWKGEMRCPHCGMDKIYKYKDGIKYKCSSCRSIFTAKVGTIFEGSKLPMVKWYMAIYLIANHKKGLSSYQLARDLKVTQKTAWFIEHRIRKAMKQENKKLSGIISSDESFIGGKNKNRHMNKKVKNANGRSFKDKIPVLGLSQKDGFVKTIAVPDTKGETIKPILLDSIESGSTLVSDEWHAYFGMSKYFNHEVVDHRKYEYKNANGNTTNNIEGFWTHLKHSIRSMYHHVSRKHIQSYLDEETFRWNTINMSQGERLVFLIGKCRERLKYKQLIYNPPTIDYGEKNERHYR